MWRPLSGSGSLISAQSKDPQLAPYFASYDDTWAEECAP